MRGGRERRGTVDRRGADRRRRHTAANKCGASALQPERAHIAAERVERDDQSGRSKKTTEKQSPKRPDWDLSQHIPLSQALSALAPEAWRTQSYLRQVGKKLALPLRTALVGVSEILTARPYDVINRSKSFPRPSQCLVPVFIKRFIKESSMLRSYARKLGREKLSKCRRPITHSWHLQPTFFVKILH
jgi:hypothetical protein